MKRRAQIAAILVILALLMVGCGGTSAAKTAPSPTPEPTPRPDRNGFDRDTNQTVTLGELSFSIPAYYKERDNGDNMIIFDFTDPTADGGLICCVWDGAITDDAFLEQEETFADKTLKKLGAVRKGALADISTAGMKGFSAYGEFKESEINGGVWFVSLNDTGKKYYGWFLLQSFDTPYNYYPDFNKILGSIKKLPEPTPEPKSETASGAVDPELKAMLDEYEAFMDEYVKFMKDYKTGSVKTSDLTKYMNMLTKYSDFMSKVDAIDEKSLSDADYLYYSQVMLRVSQKLLEAAG